MPPKKNTVPVVQPTSATKARPPKGLTETSLLKVRPPKGPVKTGTVKPGARKNRPRKIFRDNIQGLTKPAILRLAHRSGIKRLSGLVYEEMRGVIKIFVEDLVKNSIIVTEHAKRKTVTKEDFLAAMESKNLQVVVGFKEEGETFDRCNPLPEEERPTDKKEEPVISEIKYQQEHSDCLIFPRVSFGRFVREVAQDFGDDFRFSAKYLDLVQMSTENYAVEIFSNANLAALHADRQSVNPKDIQLARRIQMNSKYSRMFEY